jgi:hypothetical protein
MHSEYDFLFLYSRRLGRIARVLAVAGAVLAGAVSTALVIGLPLQPRSNVETTASPAKSSPAGGPSQKTLQEAAGTAVEKRAGGVRAALVARNDNENQSTAANAVFQTPTSLEETSLPKTALSHLKLDESAHELSGPVLFPVQPSTTAAVSSVKLPSAAATQPRFGARRSKAEMSANAAKRTPDRSTPEPDRVRPEPYSIQEFLASRP